MKQPKITTLPWHTKPNHVTNSGFKLFWTHEAGSSKTTHRLDIKGEFSEDYAQFIVTACNSHVALVEALEAALRLDYFCEHNALADKARAALALAKGTK